MPRFWVFDPDRGTFFLPPTLNPKKLTPGATRRAVCARVELPCFVVNSCAMRLADLGTLKNRFTPVGTDELIFILNKRIEEEGIKLKRAVAKNDRYLIQQHRANIQDLHFQIKKAEERRNWKKHFIEAARKELSTHDFDRIRRRAERMVADENDLVKMG